MTIWDRFVGIRVGKKTNQSVVKFFESNPNAFALIDVRKSGEHFDVAMRPEIECKFANTFNCGTESCYTPLFYYASTAFEIARLAEVVSFFQKPRKRRR